MTDSSVPLLPLSDERAIRRAQILHAAALMRQQRSADARTGAYLRLIPTRSTRARLEGHR